MGTIQEAERARGAPHLRKLAFTTTEFALIRHALNIASARSRDHAASVCVQRVADSFTEQALEMERIAREIEEAL